MNPYSGCGFFEFFGVLFQRMVGLIPGRLAADEVQLAVLAASAVACGLIGPFLVLKRMTMFANSLSHTTLVGIVLAFLLVSAGWPSLLIGACLAGLLTAGLTATLVRAFRLQEEASVGLVFTSLFAVGVILVTLFARNSHLSTEAVLGNCDALQSSDLLFAGAAALLNLLFITFFYRRFLLAAFDEPYSRTLGLSAHVWRALIYFLTALTCVSSFRAVGVLVVLALLVGPYLTARLFCHQLHRLLFWTPLLGVASCAIAVALSRSILSTSAIALSTGGVLSAVISIMFVLAVIGKRLLRSKRAVTVA
ncbi:MAG TPA: metal ABC transporter permease [Chlamydiales bacterium]|jgi:manganese/zinc/iron transport system permease protein|nr:metal ABC transporter permease [Chlamydiales bacterium]